MQVTVEQLQDLERLQDIDRRRLRAKLALEELPQPAKIRAVQEKRAEIQAKREQIESLYKNQTETLNRLSEEDAHLSERQLETQRKIEDLKGDYRSVNSLTRDLEGISKRRETLEFESAKVLKKIDEISAVAEQAGGAIAKLSAQEKQLVEAYNVRADELKAIIEQAQQKGTEIESRIPGDLLRSYKTIAAKCGGIALAHLEDVRCSACRNVIEENRLLQVRKQAPLSTCPNCGRLLIV